MKKLILITLVAVSLANAQTTWTTDKSHTNVMFTVSHLVVSDVTGDFRDFSGTLTTHLPDYSDAQAEMIIQTGSINTYNERRDNHLKSDDFFAADKFPTITFKSKSFKKTGDNQFKITGDLTMRGITKTVELDGLLKGEIAAFGGMRQGWKLSGKVDRFDFGLKWDKTIETGSLVVGREVLLQINAEMIKTDPMKADPSKK